MKRNAYNSSRSLAPSSLIMLILCSLMIVTASRSVAQEASASKVITGVVRFQEDNEPAPGVNIYLKGSSAKGTYSDANGQFEFPHSLRPGDVLVFSFIGRKTAEYVVTEQPPAFIQIVMDPEFIQMVEAVRVEGEMPKTVFARVFRRSKI